MNNVPWWALSPSPFSIVFYLLLTVYALKQIFKDLMILRKRDYLLAFTDAVLIVGFVVVYLDTFWIVACGLRFGWQYPDSVLQLIFAFGRNITGVILCYMLIGNYFRQGKLKLTNKTTQLFFLNILFLAVWFVAAPSPAFTDWTFAIRHGYSWSVILTSLFISHFIGKSLVAVIFLSIWRTKQKPKQENRKPKTTSENTK